MQKLVDINEAWTLANSLGYINDNFRSLLTNNSGIAFPSVELELGMSCFRTDQLKMYNLVNVEREIWVLTMDLTQTFVTKEYVDNITIPLERVTGLIDSVTKKVKGSLINSGTNNGQVVVVGNRNKINTNLIDTGTSSGQIPIINKNNLIETGLIDVGFNAGQIPMLQTGGKLPDSVIDDKYAKFNSTNTLVFPNGTGIRIGGV